MLIKGAKVFTDKGIFENRDIYIQDGIFTDYIENEKNVFDASGLMAVPGFMDIHFHGCDGYDFCDATQDALQAIADYELENGITAMSAATMTFDRDRLLRIMKNAAEYKSSRGAELVGINMEGPFISPEKKGAQNPAFIRNPDVNLFNELQEASGDLIKMVDIAPETEGGMEFISGLKGKVVISVAHTTADYDTAKKAFELGASHVTHLYNAMPPFSHRAPGVVGAAAEAGAFVELITDGIHLHPSVVRNTFKLFGKEHIVMVSDSMMATGLPSGDYSLGGQAVKVIGSMATLSDGTIAGSNSNLMTCFRRAVQDMQVPIEDALLAVTANPAKAIGLYDRYGSITPGKTASLLLLDDNLNIIRIYLKGRQVQGKIRT